MAVPDFQTIMLPLLKFSADEVIHTTSDALEYLAKHFNLSEEDLNLRSGKDSYLKKNFGWAKTYLKQANLLSYPIRGAFQITEQGKKVLANNPTKIDVRLLSKYDAFTKWTDAWQGENQLDENPIEKAPNAKESKQTKIELEESPDALIEKNHEKLKRILSAELLESINKASPRFFEQLVVDLLLKMGYGGSWKEAGQVIGKSGDGGIDGFIKEDKLGLDVIYIQAKRWQTVVPVGAVRDFSGSLDTPSGVVTMKGVFITTSTFTQDAWQYAASVKNKKIVLIDGYELAQLMIDHDLGVNTTATYAVKKIDSDYFEDE